MYGDYKRIWDYVVGTCHNDEYWNILPPNKVPLNLRKFFNKVIYKMIDAFMSNRLMFKPSQFQDFMDQNNNVHTYNFTCQEFEVVAQDHDSLGCMVISIHSCIHI
jgi:hypothetical protein